MISRDIQVIDIHPEGWMNLFRLFSKERKDNTKKRLPTLTIYHENGTVLKVLHSELGVLRDLPIRPFEPLETIAREQNLGMVRVIDASSIRNISSRIQRRLNMKDDFIKQLLTAYDVIRSVIGKGIKIYPAPKLPRVSYKFLQWLMDFFIKDDSCFVFYIFDENGVYTSIIMGKTDGDISLFTTHDTLASEGLNVRKPSIDHASIETGIKKKFNLEPYIGIYAELEDFQRYSSRGKIMGGLRKMRRRKSAVISPFPFRWRILFWCAGLLGK